MKNIIINKSFLFVLSISLFLLVSCGKKEAIEEHEEEKAETEVALTEMQAKTIGIETGSIEMKNLNTIIKSNGYTAVPPQNRADVSTLIGGVVKDIYVLEGTFVNKGKTMATIQNLEVQLLNLSQKFFVDVPFTRRTRMPRKSPSTPLHPPIICISSMDFCTRVHRDSNDYLPEKWGTGVDLFQLFLAK